MPIRELYERKRQCYNASILHVRVQARTHDLHPGLSRTCLPKPWKAAARAYQKKAVRWMKGRNRGRKEKEREAYVLQAWLKRRVRYEDCWKGTQSDGVHRAVCSPTFSRGKKNKEKKKKKIAGALFTERTRVPAWKVKHLKARIRASSMTTMILCHAS